MADVAGRWRVDDVEVRDVRSWQHARLELPPGLTVISGHNGAGKTSLVEAIVLAAVGASPRTGQLSEVVRHGADAFHVRASIAGPRPIDDPVVREIGYQAKVGRRLADDGVVVSRLSSWRRPGSVLVFVPEELRAVKGPPAARRRGLDRVLEALEPGFLTAQSDYAAALAQRNAVLRRVRAGQAPSPDEAYVWEQQMAAAGARMVAARRAGIEKIGPRFAEALVEMGGQTGGAIRREPSPRSLADTADDAWAEAFADYLHDRRVRDAAAGMTLAGPHRDDLWVGWGDFDARKLGSQGEQRTAALALLLAYERTLTATVARPVLLLDDVLSELDPRRRHALLEAVAGAGQTIITTADTRYRAGDEVSGATEIRVPDDIHAPA